MQEFLQSTTRRAIFKAFLAGTSTPATGKTIAVTISKNGGAFANPSGGATNATEISNGWYYVDLSTTDSGTLGPLVVLGTEGTIDDVGDWGQVVAAASRGATNLDAAVSSRSTYSGGVVASVTGDVGGNVGGSVNGDVSGSVYGNVVGKVLGGGASSFTAVGVQADVQTWLGQAVTLSSTTLLPQVNVTAINDSSGVVTFLAAYLNDLYVTAVDSSTSTPTTTVFETYAVTNFDRFTGQVIFWTTGANTGISSPVASATYTVNSKMQLTLTNALPVAPSDDDGFMVIGAAGSGGGGDPWATALPGSYPSGTAGYILGGNLGTVTANCTQLAGQTVTAAAGVTFPATVASPTNITAGTITTVTNLTNAPTSGDFTATMKTSIGTAVAASAVASVTGNVGGNVVGSVGSINSVTFPSNFSTLSIDTNGRIKVQTGINKNVALNNFEFTMYDNSDHVTPKTGQTVTATRSINGAAFASCANSVSEIGSTGTYTINLAASDLNGNTITLKFTASGADPVIFEILPNA